MDRVLLLTNNPISDSLVQWLSVRAELMTLSSKLEIKTLRSFKPDFVVSYSYRHIITLEMLNYLPGKFVNLHISFLPFNRGADPNVWSVLEGTPKGVTIHLIDEGLDTGDIIAQKEVFIDEGSESLGSSYTILHSEIEALFIAMWDDFCAGRLEHTPQRDSGTYHRASEFNEIRDLLLGDDGWSVSIDTLKNRYEKYISGNR